jgi:hypothetical protein
MKIKMGMHVVELGDGVSAAARAGCASAMPSKIANLCFNTVPARRLQIEVDGLSGSRGLRIGRSTGELRPFLVNLTALQRSLERRPSRSHSGFDE